MIPPTPGGLNFGARYELENESDWVCSGLGFCSDRMDKWRYACLQKNLGLNGEGTLNWRYANRKEDRLIDGENGERPRLQLML